MASQVHTTRSDFYVYALLRGDTGTPFYIGKGQRDRWFHHEWQARTGTRTYKAAIIRSLQIQELDVIKVKIHEGLPEAVALAYETTLIAAIGRGDKGPLVNLTDGGEGTSGIQQTPETRAKKSETMRGRKQSMEARANMSAAQRGRTFSAEHMAKLAATRRGRKQTAETIAKKSAALVGRKQPHSPEHIARAAAARIGMKHSPVHIANISRALRGKTKSPQARANMSKAQRRRSEAGRNPTEQLSLL